jgi:hypothetical protein
VAARTRAAVVIELVPTARTIANVRVAEPSERALGFLDDERAIVHASMVQVPQITAVADPWNVTPAQPPRVRLGRGAVVTDGVVVGGHATHLVLAAPDRTRFLGYRDVGPGFLRVTGDQVTLGFSSRVLWLDHALAAARAHEVTNDATGGIAVDDHRLLKSMSSYPATGGTQLQVSLVDGRAGTEAVLGTWPESSNVAYDPATHVLAIPGASSTVPRLRLDPATGKTTPLRPLQTKPYAIIDLFDPARAGGTVAIATWHRGISSRVETFVDDGRSRGPIVAASALTLPARATPIGTDERATVYTLEPGGHVHVYRAGKQVAKLHVGDDLVGGAVDRAGTLIAVYSASHVAVFDRDGNERWRTPVWSTNAARFTEPRALTPARLLVNTQGGIIAYDAPTGARAATGCAWGFGLTETEPPVTVFLAPVVCAEGS